MGRFVRTLTSWKQSRRGLLFQWVAHSRQNYQTDLVTFGLNLSYQDSTLGISMTCENFAPFGLSSPHIHPSAWEMVLVLKGRLEVGFVTTNPENRLITKFLQVGDVFDFPQRLVHFQRNARGDAHAASAFSSQNSELTHVSIVYFGSNPEVPVDVLAKSFQIAEKTASQMSSSGGI